MLAMTVDQPGRAVEPACGNKLNPHDQLSLKAETECHQKVLKRLWYDSQVGCHASKESLERGQPRCIE